MSLQPVKFLLFGSLSLSLFLGNSIAQAQYTSNSNGDVVVPTTSNGGSTGSSGSTISSGDRYPSGGSSVGADSNARFICQQYNGQYTVMYNPQSQPGQGFAWANPRSLGGGWDTARRCNTIAQRLETYRRDGLLELQTSVENGQNVVCVTTEANPACRIVLTVPPEKDPYIIRNSVFENLASADNGQQTFGVNTYRSQAGSDIGQIYRTVTGSGNNTRSSKSPISLKPFLDKADGGTATSMRNGVRTGRQQSKPQSGARLKPGNFR
jgi:Circadian oscillating protein COP23